MKDTSKVGWLLCRQIAIYKSGQFKIDPMSNMKPV